MIDRPTSAVWPVISRLTLEKGDGVEENGVGLAVGNGLTAAQGPDPLRPAQRIVDVGLDEERGPADELEVARADVGHRVADDLAQLGHDRGRVGVEDHLGRDLRLQAEGIVRSVDPDGDDVKGGGVPGHVLPQDLLDPRDIPVREAGDEDEHDPRPALREEVDEPPEIGIAALELSLLRAEADGDAEVALLRAPVLQVEARKGEIIKVAWSFPARFKLSRAAVRRYGSSISSSKGFL